jgi:hypothetical protein
MTAPEEPQPDVTVPGHLASIGVCRSLTVTSVSEIGCFCTTPRKGTFQPWYREIIRERRPGGLGESRQDHPSSGNGIEIPILRRQAAMAQMRFLFCRYKPL